jgi:hypothetical protein
MARTAALSTLAALCVGALSAQAHHSLAAFDHDKQIVIDGVVKSFEFANPHSRLIVVERLADGATAEWHFETAGPSVLFRYNLTSQTLATGEHITVTAHPQRNDPKGGAIMRLVKPDGTTFMLENAN